MAHPPANPLIAALAEGRAEAFAALYDRLGPAMMRVARARLGSGGDAEDAVQDVFVELVRRGDELKRVHDLDAYVLAMLRNSVSRRIQRIARERAARCELADQPGASTEAVASDDLSAALDRLSPEQREVIALKIDAGLTFAQIGEVLSISPNTVASRYRYAIAKLREALE